METMIPALAAPIVRAMSFVFAGPLGPQPVGWVLLVASIGAAGAILRRRGA
jgi:hypothetical protein